MSDNSMNVAASELKVANIVVDEFHFKNGTHYSESVFSNGFSHIEYDDASEQWVGIVGFQLRTGIDENAENERLHQIVVKMHGTYSLHGKKTPEEKDSFQLLLRTTGAFNVLAAMRSIILATTSTLGSMPGYITPFWNLKKYKWDDDPFEKKESE